MVEEVEVFCAPETGLCTLDVTGLASRPAWLAV